MSNITLSIPEEVLKEVRSYAKKNNTFFEYSKIEGIELVLKHLSHRINHGVDLSLSLPLFINKKEKIEQDFFVFMKEMIEFVKKEIEALER